MTSPRTVVTGLEQLGWTVEMVSLCADEVINTRDDGGDEERALAAFVLENKLAITQEARVAIFQEADARWYGSRLQQSAGAYIQPCMSV